MTYSIEYAYGYKCNESRQNLFMTGSSSVIYMTAALGVIHDYQSNTQKFFGGGVVDQEAKNISADD